MVYGNPSRRSSSSSLRAPPEDQINAWRANGVDLANIFFNNLSTEAELRTHITNLPRLEDLERQYVLHAAVTHFQAATQWRNAGGDRGRRYSANRALTDELSQRNAMEATFARTAIPFGYRTIYEMAARDAFNLHFRRLGWMVEGRNHGSNWTGDRAALEESLLPTRPQAREFYDDYVQAALDAYDRRVVWRNQGHHVGSNWSRDRAALEGYLAGRRAETGIYHTCS